MLSSISAYAVLQGIKKIRKVSFKLNQEMYTLEKGVRVGQCQRKVLT